jgi:tRNA pseudouridine38-40 synthase
VADYSGGDPDRQTARARLYNPSPVTKMRTLKMTIAYDGTPYAGWQVQPGRPTVQGVIEAALGRMLRETTRIAGAGRTDAGVHALGQVASFATGRAIPLDGLRSGLNARLPETIRVLAAEEAPEGFHARADARAKEYRYRLSRARVVLPFVAPFVAPVRGRLDVEAMREAARRFVGRHDFTSFCPTDCAIEDRRRSIESSEIAETADEVVYEVRGEGFLRHMVRTIAGTLVEVGRGRVRPAEIDAIIAARDRRRAGPCAPARGLVLVRVLYGSPVAGAPA